MSRRNTFIRSLHDLGAAAWFGGALMGAVALNGASKDVSDPAERAGVATAGWARWAPVNTGAIAMHLVGGLGVLISNRQRVAAQSGVTANTAIKTALTVAAVGATAWSGYLGVQLQKIPDVPSSGGTVPDDRTPAQAAQVQQQLRVMQWVTPVLTGVIVVLGAQQGEQQRPSQIVKGAAAKAKDFALRN